MTEIRCAAIALRATARQLLPSSSYSSLVPYKILIHKDEYEKNQIRSHAYALRLFLFSAFHIPTSEFLTPFTRHVTLCNPSGLISSYLVIISFISYPQLFIITVKN